MTTKKLTKLLALYLPYILLGLVATNFGEAWRLAEGKELGDKIMSMVGTLPLAFANPLPSLHPLDFHSIHHTGALPVRQRISVLRFECSLQQFDYGGQKEAEKSEWTYPRYSRLRQKFLGKA